MSDNLTKLVLRIAELELDVANANDREKVWRDGFLAYHRCVPWSWEDRREVIRVASKMRDDDLAKLPPPFAGNSNEPLVGGLEPDKDDSTTPESDDRGPFIVHPRSDGKQVWSCTHHGKRPCLECFPAGLVNAKEIDGVDHK